MRPELGLIEGYFGRAWLWEDRAMVATHLADAGYTFYHYAPKAEAKLRRAWRDPFTDSELADLTAFSAHCRAVGLRFGIGLTPYGIHDGFGAPERTALAAKIAQLDAISIDDLAILFDDMQADQPGVAALQADVVGWAMSLTQATHGYICPSYYSSDPVLDRVFGQRAPDYLAELGRRLVPEVQVYWTGPEVCARAISPGHLRRVGEELGRPPCLWDNYPVNDGARMSAFLHLRGFSGRSAEIAEHISGHAANPALQPGLSCIPLLTLQQLYDHPQDYCYADAWFDAATRLSGEAFAQTLRADLLTFQDTGLHRISDERKATLKARYAAFGLPLADEVVRWLDSYYNSTGEDVQTQ
jgi:hyaluronoglucosaminidase